MQPRKSRPRILYQTGKVSENIYDSVIFDDFKAGKTSNRNDPDDKIIGFTRKAPLGQTENALKQSLNNQKSFQRLIL